MKKAIFLDRDGTLTVDKGYTYEVNKLELNHNVIEGLQQLKGYLFFIVTNQSGIGKGLYTQEDMDIFHNHLLTELEQHNISVTKIYFCPHVPEDNCECRKPKIKHIMDAQKEFNIELSQSWVIGDRTTDISLAKQAGCKGILILTGEGSKEVQQAKKVGYDFAAADLLQASIFITADKNKLVSLQELKEIINQKKVKGKKIVFLSGSFDVLHKGHEKILQEAKAQGDILVVGLNSDHSIKKNKGNERPINKEENRVVMLSQFSYVNFVTLFNEENPIHIIKKIHPDIFVNGSEYGENCIEASAVKQYGGRIYIVELLKGYSSSSIIQKNEIVTKKNLSSD